MNLGIRHTTGDVLLLTHDCRLAPGCVEVLEGRLAECPDVGIVGPLLADARSPEVIFSAGGIFAPRARQLHRRETQQSSDGADRPWVESAWLDGACLLIRRAVLDRRPFDEGYFLYFEEVEFCVRTARDGWRIECVQSAFASQVPGVGAEAPALWTRNRLRFLWRNARRHFPRELAVATLRGLRSIRTRTARLKLRGIAALVTREDPRRLHGLRGS